jgi:serine/threonine-protein kinase
MINNGDIISFRKNEYEVINSNLGSGSFGKTVLLKDPFIDVQFVAKKYEPEYPELKEQFYKSFLQEIKILHKLNHPNIVRAYYYFAYENEFSGYLIMEYIDGMTIDKHFMDLMPWEDIGTPDRVFSQLIDGFMYIEENNILHRDIREGNILIDKNGVVKIIDFGLGKFFKPTDISDDSMADIINRSGLDRLPNEYSTGVYDVQTDMFYLAELFNRVLRNTSCSNMFSYHPILQKMMIVDKNERYDSFSQIQEDVSKRNFETFEIEQHDKNIYQDFSNALVSVISCFTNDKKFNNDIESFETCLKDLIKKNCFEDELYETVDLSRLLVLSAYRYRPKASVSMSIITEFDKWFSSLSADSKQLVLNNIIAKLSATVEEELEDDLPF